MLKVENLHAFYGKSHVLHGVHFGVGEGEIVALLGRNGSGRSTTAKAPATRSRRDRPPSAASLRVASVSRTMFAL